MVVLTNGMYSSTRVNPLVIFIVNLPGSQMVLNLKRCQKIHLSHLKLLCPVVNLQQHKLSFNHTMQCNNLSCTKWEHLNQWQCHSLMDTNNIQDTHHNSQDIHHKPAIPNSTLATLHSSLDILLNNTLDTLLNNLDIHLSNILVTLLSSLVTLNSLATHHKLIHSNNLMQVDSHQPILNNSQERKELTEKEKTNIRAVADLDHANVHENELLQITEATGALAEVIAPMLVTSNVHAARLGCKKIGLRKETIRRLHATIAKEIVGL